MSALQEPLREPCSLSLGWRKGALGAPSFSLGCLDPRVDRGSPWGQLGSPPAYGLCSGVPGPRHTHSTQVAQASCVPEVVSASAPCSDLSSWRCTRGTMGDTLS